MAAVVDNCQCLLVGPGVLGDSTLVVVKNFFDGGYAEVGLLHDIEIDIEVIAFNISAEDLHVLLDFREVCEAFLCWVSVFVYCYKADGSVVNIAKDKALTFVWGEVG